MCHDCSTCDVVTINCPLHEGTRGLFDKELIGKMKPGSYLVRPRSSVCRSCMRSWGVMAVTALISLDPACCVQTQLGPCATSYASSTSMRYTSGCCGTSTVCKQLCMQDAFTIPGRRSTQRVAPSATRML